jgi:hypothetical protein
LAASCCCNDRMNIRDLMFRENRNTASLVLCRSGKEFLNWILVLLVPLTFASCASTKLNGSFLTEGPAFANKEFQPTNCYSGDREYFFGVDLTSKTDPMQIRVLQDPVKGTFVRIVNTGSEKQEEFVFDSNSCKSLRGVLKQTKWEVNEIRDMSGELELDCTVSGSSVKGNIVFQHCH